MFGTKKKLMAAVIMLVISAIMLTSASYAWFTISTNPEISSMTAKVVTNENLEIALAKSDSALPEVGGAGNYYTWGNIIDLTSILTNDKLLPITLYESEPPKTFKYPDYDTDGRIEALNSLVEATTSATGFGTLNDGATPPKAYAYYIDFWVRSNITGNLALSTATERSSGATAKGLGSQLWILGNTEDVEANVNAIAKGLRIAFKELASVTNIEAGTIAATSDTEPIASTTGTIGTGGTVDATAKQVTIAAENDAYAVAFTNTDIVGLEANKAKLIRMYVYYEGSTLTNADALLGPDLVNANLNIQFALVDNSGEVLVNTSMDKFD